MIRAHVLICGGTGCTSSGSVEIQKAFLENIEKNGLSEEVKLVQTGCFGLCALGPVVIIYPEGTFYSRVTKEDVAEIVEEHLLKGRIVDRLVYKDTGEEKTILFGLTGTGYFDMTAYSNFNEGKMSDYIPTDEDLAVGFAGLPDIK